MKLANGWLATAEYCLDLAKCRYDEDKHAVYSDKAQAYVDLSLFEHQILVVDRLETLEKAKSKMSTPSLVTTAGIQAASGVGGSLAGTSHQERGRSLHRRDKERHSRQEAGTTLVIL